MRDEVRIGDSRWADVPFPGADLTVRRCEGGLEVRGRTLAEGVPLTISLGAVTVTLETMSPEVLPRPGRTAWNTPFVDVRVLVATVAVALTGTFIDSVDRFVQSDPIATEQLAELLDPGWAEDATQSARARLDAPEKLPEGVVPERTFQVPTAEPLPVTFIAELPR